MKTVLCTALIDPCNNSDLGALVYRDASILRNIMRFRGSPDGESFRREVGQVLAVGSGREFNASINAGLTRTIAPSVLQRAHDKLLTLMTENARIVAVPAVWGNASQSDSITRLWRAKSEKMLLTLGRTTLVFVDRERNCVCVVWPRCAAELSQTPARSADRLGVDFRFRRQPPPRQVPTSRPSLSSHGRE